MNSRLYELGVLLFAGVGLLTIVFFLVRAIGSRSWQWLGSFILSLIASWAAFYIIIIKFNLGPRIPTPTPPTGSAAAVYEILGVLLYAPAVLFILAFAVFGPTDRAKRVFLWALLLVALLCAGWLFLET